MVTMKDLLQMAQDVKLVELAIGWVLANVAMEWAWYQNKPKLQKHLLMVGFCGVISIGATVAYYFSYGGTAPLVDLIANVVYSLGASYVSTQINYNRLRTAEAKKA